MGAAVDALVVAVGSGGTLSVLATSLRAWLCQPRRSDVWIRVQDASGTVLNIAADRVDAQQADGLLRQALDFGSAEG
jgi:cysteine synthase